MSNLPAIYIANGTAILLLSTILLSFKKPIRNALIDERIFHAMVHLNMLQCVVESVAFYIDGKMGYRTLSIVLDVFLFINSATLAYCWVIYADYKLFADIDRLKRIYPFLAIPTVLNLIGSLLNLVTPVFFSVDQYNVYHRTSLFFIPYIINYFYLIYGVVFIYLYRKKVHRRMFLPASLFMIPVIIGSLLQIIFYGYSLIWLGVSVGMISLFMNVQNEASYVDMLSGLFNRQYLNNILFMCSKKKDTANILAGIMLDIDNFKNINDEFGHSVGDEAISNVGQILHSAVRDKGLIFRYGGDEFVILMRIKNPQKEITDMIDAIKTKTTLFNETEKKPYKLDFSLGYGTFQNKHESIDDFLKKIDASMYEDKNRKISAGIISDRRHEAFMV